MYLPIGLFGVSIATAVLPAVSRHAAVDDLDGVRDTVSRGLSPDADAERAGDGRPVRPRHADRPAAVRARPVPAGRHRRRPPRRCASTRSAWSATRRRESRRRPSTRCGRAGCRSMVSVVAIAANIVLSLALVRTLGFRGLALGTSLAAIANGAAADAPAAAPPRRHRRRPSGGRVREDRWPSVAMAAVVVGRELGATALVAGDGVVAQAIRLAVAIGSGWARSPAPRDCWHRRIPRSCDAGARAARRLTRRDEKSSMRTGKLPAARFQTVTARALLSPRVTAYPSGCTIGVRAMRRYPSRYASSFSFGPGPLSTALKALIGANVAMFLAHVASARPADRRALGLVPSLVLTRLRVWQLGHLHVPARRAVPHPVQHAGAVDVRRRARADLGDALFPEVLFRHRRSAPAC